MGIVLRLLRRRKIVLAVAGGCAGLVAFLTGLIGLINPACGYYEFFFCPQPLVTGNGLLIDCGADETELAKTKRLLSKFGFSPYKIIFTRFGGMDYTDGTNDSEVMVSDETHQSFDEPARWLAARLSRHGHPWKVSRGTSVFENSAEQKTALVFNLRESSCVKSEVLSSRWSDRYFPQEALGPWAVSASNHGKSYSRRSVQNFIDTNSSYTIKYDSYKIKGSDPDWGWIAIVGRNLDPDRAQEALDVYASRFDEKQHFQGFIFRASH